MLAEISGQNTKPSRIVSPNLTHKNNTSFQTFISQIQMASNKEQSIRQALSLSSKLQRFLQCRSQPSRTCGVGATHGRRQAEDHNACPTKRKEPFLRGFEIYNGRIDVPRTPKFAVLSQKSSKSRRFPTVGKKLRLRFISRHSEIRIRRSQPIDINRLSTLLPLLLGAFSATLSVYGANFR